MSETTARPSLAAGFAAANRPTVALQNPLDLYGSYLSLQSAQNENALFQAKKAGGQAFLNSLNPDGTTSQTGLLQGLKSDPNTGLVAQDVAQKGQTLSQQEYDQKMKRLTYVGTLGAQILHDNNGTAPLDAVKTAFDAAVRDGHATKADEDSVMSTFGPNPATNATRLRQMLTGTMSAQEAAQTAYGTPGVTTTAGGSLQPIVTDAQGRGIRPVGQPISQAGQDELVSTIDVNKTLPDGVTPNPNFRRTVQMRKGDVVQMLLKNGQPVPPALSPLGTGRPLPAALAPSQNRSPAAPVPAAGAAPAVAPVTPAPVTPPAPTPVVTGLAPGEAKGIEAGVGSFQDLAAEVPPSRVRATALDNMMSDTTQFNTGPLADRLAKLRALGNAVGVNVDTTGLSAAEGFNKLASQLQIAAQRGGGSDAQLGAAGQANPHIDLSPAGMDKMLRQLRGNEDYVQARAELGAKYTDQGDKPGFESGIASKLSQRVFQYDRMTDAQKREFMNTLGPNNDPKARQKAQLDFIRQHQETHDTLGR
jgi:hypothetical protein